MQDCDRVHGGSDLPFVGYFDGFSGKQNGGGVVVRQVTFALGTL